MLVLHSVINKDSLMLRRLCDKLHGRPSQLLLARPAVIDRAIRLESRFLPTPPAFDTPVRRGFPSEYRHKVWYAKTRMACLSDYEKRLKIMFIRFDRTYESDRQTDTHDGVGRACIASRGNISNMNAQ